MPDKRYIDIKVIDGGWKIDAGAQPTQCSDLYSIAQDIKHAIMESGLARKLVAERNPILRADVLLQIEQKPSWITALFPARRKPPKAKQETSYSLPTHTTTSNPSAPR